MVRNWKRKWFDEQLLPALMEPIVEAGDRQDARLKFLEALAAKHVAPSSAPRRFERLCEAASREDADLTVPADATFAALVAALPRVVARAPETQVRAGIEQLGKAVDSELQGSTDDSAEEVVEALLELTVAVGREREASSEVGLGWLLSIVSILARHPPLHRPLWRRIRRLCLCHGAEMDAHQLCAVANFLACCSVLRTSEIDICVHDEGRSHNNNCIPYFLFDYSEEEGADGINGTRHPGAELTSALLTEVVRGASLAGWAVRLVCAITVAVTSVAKRLTCSLHSMAPATIIPQSDDPTHDPPEGGPLIVGYLPPTALHLLGWLDHHCALQQALALTSTGSTTGQQPHGGMSELYLLHSKLAAPIIKSAAGKKLMEAAGPPPLWMVLALEAAVLSKRAPQVGANEIACTTGGDASAQCYLQRLALHTRRQHGTSAWQCLAAEMGESLGGALSSRATPTDIQRRRDATACVGEGEERSFQECRRWACAAWPILAALQDAPWRLTLGGPEQQPAPMSQQDWTVRLVAHLLAPLLLADDELGASSAEKAASRSVLSKLALSLLLRVPESSSSPVSSPGRRLQAASAVVSSCLVGLHANGGSKDDEAQNVHTVEAKLLQLIDAYDLF